MTNEILKKLSLSDKEIKIYLSLSNLGVQTVQQISQQSFINRTTTYRILEELEEKGLIEWIIDDRGRKAKCSSPKNLELLLAKQKKDALEVEQGLPNLIEQLSLIQPTNKLTTSVRYYKGQSGIEQMIWNTLHAKKMTKSYAPLQRRDFIDPKFEDRFEEEWVCRGLNDFIITNETDQFYRDRLIASYAKVIEIKTISKEKFYLTNDIAIYNNILAIMSLEKGNLVGVEIENAEIAKTQKSLFDIVWEVAKPI